MPNYNAIEPNTIVLVRGKLAYSRLTRQIDGQELINDQQRRQQRGFIPINRPYTTATVNGAMIVPSNPNGQKTTAETIVEQGFYASKNANVQAQGYSFTAYNKGRNLPWIAQMQGDKAIQIVPEGELASGLDVTLVTRIFRGKPNNGLTVEGVIVNEPIRYYSGSTAGLASLGITFVPNPDANTKPNSGDNGGAPAGAAAPAPATAQPMAAQPAAPAYPYGTAQTPFSTPVSAPVGNPYAAAPAQSAAPAQAPTQAPVQQQPTQAPMQAPVQPTNGMPFAPAPNANQGGIRWDANARQY